MKVKFSAEAKIKLTIDYYTSQRDEALPLSMSAFAKKYQCSQACISNNIKYTSMDITAEVIRAMQANYPAEGLLMKYQTTPTILGAIAEVGIRKAYHDVEEQNRVLSEVSQYLSTLYHEKV